MSQIRNTGIIDNVFGTFATFATSTQNLKDIRNSSLWTGSHIMDILRSQNKNVDFLVCHSRFNLSHF